MTLRATMVAGGLALALVAATLGAGFAAFVAAARRPAAEPPLADGIVALTGGAERIGTALHLLAAGRARLLLVSGVGRSAGLAELARRSDVDPAALQDRVTLGRDAATTLGNATETAAWAQANGVKTLIVVTAGYHMPRALLELHRAMPAVQLFPLPVHPPIPLPGRTRLLASEYAKLLGAWAGVPRLTRSPPDRHGTPVDNSVSG